MLDANLGSGMYFWLKVFHITAMSVWFVGLFFLPRLLAAHRPDSDEDEQAVAPEAKTLYFQLMTPAGVLAIALGMVLIAYIPQSAWLVLKLMVVVVAVCLHLYLGVVLYDLGRNKHRHGVWFYRVLAWLPLLLLLVLAALTGAKPDSLGGLPPPPG